MMQTNLSTSTSRNGEAVARRGGIAGNGRCSGQRRRALTAATSSVRALAFGMLVLVPGTSVASGSSFHGLRAYAPLLDALEIVVRPREVLAVDAVLGGGVVRERLEAGERVLWSGARGLVGIVVTDERVLSITPQSPRWREERYSIKESLPQSVLLGDRVALVITSHRVIGVIGSSGKVVEHEIGVHETVIDGVTGENVAVVVTDKRVLGLSAFAGGFFAERIPIHEDVEYASARANLATVTTRRRVLIFRAPFGTWENRELGLLH